MANPNQSTTSTYIGGGAAVRVGDATSSPVAFYNATLTTQPTSASQAAAISTAAVSALSGTIFGFATSTQPDQMVKLLNQLRSDLVALGLIKGS